ncbi:MAG: hypothetical protein HY547_10420 [Elusimicrobia bacterium]|nr:hypothetical protein [Elusimicrobiota bacterium]
MSKVRSPKSKKKNRIFLFLSLLATSGFGRWALDSYGAQAPEAAMNFQVKNYHIKSYKSVWDPQTGLVTMDQDVDIELFLSDGTTAHIYGDHAEENRVEGTGLAQGHVRSLWKDLLTITSDEARWDLVAQKAQFYSPGVSSAAYRSSHLEHRLFMDGQLLMDYDILENSVDQQNHSMMTVTKAKGIWTPYAKK